MVANRAVSGVGFIIAGNVDLLNKTKELCRVYDIHPARSKGQNFLVKEEIYDKIIEAAELKKDDVVLEVGPGLGFLTVKLAKRVKKVIAVELDDKLAKYLKTVVDAQKFNNVEIINANILNWQISNFKFLISNKIPNSKSQTKNSDNTSRGYKIVANLPYNITSIFLRKFLSEVEKKELSSGYPELSSGESSGEKPELMVLMLQKEVAERIAAKPGKMSLLAVSVQFYSRPGGTEVIEIVSKDNFWPKPEVDSAIVKIKTRDSGVIARSGNDEAIFNSSGEKQHIKDRHAPFHSARDDKLEKEFFRLVKIGFSARRKMLKNNLANGFHIKQEEAEKWLLDAGFAPKVRAQELSVKDWVKLLKEKQKLSFWEFPEA